MFGNLVPIKNSKSTYNLIGQLCISIYLIVLEFGSFESLGVCWWHLIKRLLDDVWLKTNCYLCISIYKKFTAVLAEWLRRLLHSSLYGSRKTQVWIPLRTYIGLPDDVWLIARLPYVLALRLQMYFAWLNTNNTILN